MVKRLLGQAGYMAEFAETGTAEGVVEAGDPNFDAIFLDYMLPSGSGLSYLSDFRQKWPRAAIFMLTGQGDEELAKSAIQLGATDYVQKSVINKSALKRMLDNGLAQARARWQIEEQRRDLETFSEVLVHDFKEPVRALAFLAEQIEEDLDEGRIDEVRKELRLLHKSSAQMMEMIRSLSDHVRFDRDERVEPTTIADLVDRALTSLEREIASRDAEISIDLRRAPDEIFCSPPQVSQVMQNLVGNAIKYTTGKRPRIKIIVVGDDQSGVLFEVSDNGIGVDPDQVERIFEPFTRASNVGAVTGTGLGLATCRKIVGRHGGRIGCSPNAGGGTRMWFSIPIGRTTSTVRPGNLDRSIEAGRSA